MIRFQSFEIYTIYLTQHRLIRAWLRADYVLVWNRCHKAANHNHEPSKNQDDERVYMVNSNYASEYGS